MGVVIAGDNPPSYSPQILAQTSNIPAKIAQIRHQANAIDIIVKRSPGSTPTELSQPVTFNVSAADNYPMMLLGDKDYGFARLIYSGGVWSMDNAFKINMAYDFNNIYASKTYTNPSFDATRYVTIHDGATLTLLGAGTINRQFKMGSYATLNVNGAYTFSGSSFTRKDPAYPWNTVYLNADGVTMSGMVMTGAQTGLTDSRIERNGWHGVYMQYGFAGTSTP